MSRLRLPVSERDHVAGATRPTLVLVEYGDYQCPFSAHAYLVTEQLVSRFPDELQFVYRHFPLSEIHPDAVAAAEAAEAAGAQDSFWDMHGLLFTNQDELDHEHLLGFAGELELDVERFAEDLESHRYLPHVEEDFMSGVRSGVNGTPCFFLDNVRYDGSWDAPSMVRAIEQALTRHGVEVR